MLKNFSHRRRVLFLMLTMAATVALVATFSLVALYRVAFTQHQERLVEIVSSRTAMIEEMVQANLKAFPDAERADLLHRAVLVLERSTERFPVIGRPGDLVVGERTPAGIRLLYADRLPPSLLRDPVPFGSILAEPMQRALSGESGAAVLTDRAGRTVLAAYQHAGSLGLGIVSKMELSEIRKPFIQAGIFTGAGALIFILLGWIMLKQVSDPVLSLLEENEKKYRTLFESSTEALFISSEVVEDCNHQACRMLGLSREEIIGKSIFELTSPTRRGLQSSPPPAADLSENAGPGPLEIAEWRFSRKDGATVDAEVVTKPIQLGRREMWLTTARDVTARKATEKRLHTLSRAIEQHPTAILMLDSQFRIQYANSEFTKLTGYSVEESLGNHPKFLTAEEMDRPHHDQVEETLGKGKSWKGEFLNRRKNGQLFWSEVIMCPLRDADGNITHFLEVNEDITERKRKDQNLQLTQFTVDRATEAIYWIDQKGRILYANEAASKSLGYLREELLRLSVFDIAVDSTPQSWAEGWNSIKIQGYGTKEATHRKKDGTLFLTEIYASYLEFGDREICCAFARDISERKHLEEQFRQSQKMEAVGQLAGGIAHDFNNLLTGINGYADLVLEQLGKDSPVSQDVAAIKSIGVRASRLTRQLLAFSRRQAFEPVVLNVNAAIGEMEHMLRRLIGEDIRLEIDFDSQAGSIEIDPGQFEQLFLNLAVNARDAMPEGGRLTIRTAQQKSHQAPGGSGFPPAAGDRVLIEVRDTGCGMEESVREKIFEPFFTTKEPGKGTGLGLSTVYGIVKQSHGSVEVSSQVGQGTRFLLTFPAVKEDTATPSREAPPECRGGNETLLLVEDEPSVMELSRRILLRDGFRVLAAANPSQALQISREHTGTIEVLLTDVVMPGMNGHKLAQEIRKQRPEICVVYMSGYTENATLYKIERSGATILQKPFRSSALACAIRNALNQHSISKAG